jgi:hypothetical protein
MPLHGVLGVRTLSDSNGIKEWEKKLKSPLDLVEDYAKKAGLSSTDWIEQEYIPKFANFLADMHFRYGILPEAHTQNITVRINVQDGRIEGFDFRDMRDVLFDALPTVLRGAHQIGPIPKEASRINWHFLQPIARTAGPNTFWYASQGVDSFISSNNSMARGSAILSFLKAYVARAQEIAGIPIQISDKNKKLLDYLSRKGVDSRDIIPREKYAIQGVVQETYDQISKHRFDSLLERSVALNQASLHKVFKSHLADESISWILPRSRARFKVARSIPGIGLNYRYDGYGILLRDRTGAPLAYAYDLSPEERAIIEEAPRVQSYFNCLRSALSRLLGLRR